MRIIAVKTKNLGIPMVRFDPINHKAKPALEIITDIPFLLEKDDQIQVVDEKGNVTNYLIHSVETD